MIAALAISALGLTLSSPAWADGPCPSALATATTPMTGSVLETMDASSYTYLRINVGAEGTWAAVPLSPVAVGQCVSLLSPKRIVDFQSPTLRRTFAEIYFTTLADASAESRMVMTHDRATVGEDGQLDAIPLASGESAHTVAQLHAQRLELAGQAVAVRGQVTKVSDGIMSKTWLHLVDGSGSAEAKDHEIIVTCVDCTATVGDIVQADGTLGIDLDLGYGYKYDVLVQDAAISP